MVQDERKLAAEISADPAFTALEASGAPIVALSGEPRILYANAAAIAVCGSSPGPELFVASEDGAERLKRLLEQLVNNGAPRLERLPLTFANESRAVTVLCRRLAGEPAIFVIAALGLRGPVEPTAAADAAAMTSPPDLAFERRRAALVARHGAAARFLWKSDAQGRFTEVTHILADVVGARNADIIGRHIDEASQALGLESAFADALASHRSWANICVHWPIEEPLCAAPTTLGALPSFDADRRFAGYQGYGVLRLDLAAPREVPGPTAHSPAPVAEPPRVARRPVNNIVPLRPPLASSPRQPSAEQRQPALTPVEKSAFDEIARTLAPSQSDAPNPASSARGLIEHVTRALETRAPALESGAVGGLIDILPIGVLVARGSRALYANQTLLDYLGYANLEQMAESGGLARLFVGASAGRLSRPDSASPRAVEVTAQDGEELDVEAHVQSVVWEGEPATLISLRRPTAKPAQSEKGGQAAQLGRLTAERDVLIEAFEVSGGAEAILSEQGRVERASAAFAAAFGLTPELAVGRDLATFFQGDDSRRVAAFFASAVGASGEVALSIQRRLRLRALGGEPRRFVCTLSREETSAEAQAARAAAERASALKSEFLARVSHEIRTPLNAIIGFAEVMIEERFGPIGSERYKEYLKDVLASGQHVLSLVNDLLDLSKIEAGKLELRSDPIDVNAIIGECASIMQAQANKQRVIMRLSLAAQLPRIRADERSLRQILLNLLSNAVKFNVPGGQVIVSTAQTDAGYVVIRVKDTGIGMSHDEIELALEPFRQAETSRKAQGTGLGLPVTKALIEANHATLLITSRKNEGTLIEVGFPPRPSLAAE